MDPTIFSEGIANSAEFLVAFGSIIGLLGVIIGFLSFFVLGRYSRKYSIIIIVFSAVLLLICGPTAGIEYFHIRL
ncbi:MAG: hypothetical protein P8Y70_21450 [Candidatus Lokiarchaeota archaeon]